MSQQPQESVHTVLYDAQGNPVTAWYDEYGRLHHDTVLAAPVPDMAAAQSAGSFRRRPMLLRRLIGVAVIAAFAFTVYWIIFQTPLLGPVLAYAQPVQDGINWVLEDPKRAWAAAAVMVIPHIGLYFMIFEDR